MNISKEELIQLKTLAEKMLSSMNEEEVVETPPQKKKRGRPKKVKEEVWEEPVEEELIDEIPQDDDEDVYSNITGVECSTESFKRIKNRPNKFLDLVKRADIKREVNEELSKSKFIKDNVQTERVARPNPIVEVRCTKCNRRFKVSQSLVTSRYRCNECSRGP